MATNSHVAADARVRARYPVLSQAIVAGGSGQLRNKATTGGNLLQRTRCAYFYDTSKPCNKRAPGSGCGGAGGAEPQRRRSSAPATPASPPTPPTWPWRWSRWTPRSRPCRPPARRGPSPLDELHRLPGETPHIETHLIPGELITAVVLPPPPAGGQVYRKVRDRASYAARPRQRRGGRRDQVRAGAWCAHKPWRAADAEAALASGASPAEAIAAELAQAQRHGRNGFKIPWSAGSPPRPSTQANGRGA